MLIEMHAKCVWTRSEAQPFSKQRRKDEQAEQYKRHDLDLTITKIDRRSMGGGTWVIGMVNDQYKFNALVFPDHAESEDYELGQSKISKLWIERTADHKRHFRVSIVRGKYFCICIWMKPERTLTHCDVDALQPLPRPMASN